MIMIMIIEKMSQCSRLLIHATKPTYVRFAVMAHGGRDYCASGFGYAGGTRTERGCEMLCEIVPAAWKKREALTACVGRLIAL